MEGSSMVDIFTCFWFLFVVFGFLLKMVGGSLW